jgi:UDP-N-acetylmuramoyl-L-alanyl-D-glutamate--2,6-diaminopimelate ligase
MSLKVHVLGDYLDLLQKYGLLTEQHICPGALARKVSAVSCDSRENLRDAIFFCKGSHFREEYLRDAVRQGAFCYVSEKKYDMPAVSCVLVSDVRRAMALFAAFFYNDAWKRLHLIGVTGTKGKSSTVYFLKYIFDEFLESVGKRKSGLISSIDTWDGVERFESRLTTPEPLDLHRHFYHAAENGIEYFEMEVSSQALKYGRVLGVRFRVACFLNIGRITSAVWSTRRGGLFQSKLKTFSRAKLPA